MSAPDPEIAQMFLVTTAAFLGMAAVYILDLYMII
jgi:hypothetical protein